MEEKRGPSGGWGSKAENKHLKKDLTEGMEGKKRQHRLNKGVSVGLTWGPKIGRERRKEGVSMRVGTKKNANEGVSVGGWKKKRQTCIKKGVPGGACAQKAGNKDQKTGLSGGLKKNTNVDQRRPKKGSQFFLF